MAKDDIPHLIATPVQQLAHLGYKRYLPNKSLQPWIQCYWVAQQYNLPVDGFTENLYPDGGSSLIFNFGASAVPDISINISYTTDKIIVQSYIDCIGVRFNPGGISRLFAVHVTSLLDTVQQCEFTKNSLSSLQSQLGEVSVTTARLAILENWLLEKAQKQNLVEGIFEQFVTYFLESDSDMETIVQKQSMSRRQLERRFQQLIGLSPGHLKYLHRVKKARYIITQNPAASLTGVALDCGFYDQAHFIRQFQKITGQTPGQYKQRKMSQKYNTNI